MSTITWKRKDNRNGFSLHLTYEIDGRTFSGSIIYKNEISSRKAEAIFNFQSLGIYEKIDTNLTEEEMKQKALMFLKEKAKIRIKEISSLVSLIDEELK